jgi:hypothetical protein
MLKNKIKKNNYTKKLKKIEVKRMRTQFKIKSK